MSAMPATDPIKTDARKAAALLLGVSFRSWLLTWKDRFKMFEGFAIQDRID